MKTPSATTELMRMTPQELQKEIALKRSECSKLRIAIEMGSEKNHARYRRLHREIARMVMVYDAMKKSATSLPPATPPSTPTKSPKVPVSSRSPKKKK